jgi:hypothetical protein
MMPHSQATMHGCGCGPHHWGPSPRCCRKEPKELLVEVAATLNRPAPPTDSPGLSPAPNATVPPGQTVNNTASGHAIIGGGCCVQLSVEYMPANVSVTDQTCRVIVDVADSEGTAMLWAKEFKGGYHVNECVITTYPGAKLDVTVINAIACVRWCEIFSC